MRRSILFLAAILMLAGFSNRVYANALVISNLSRDSAAQTVTFHIQWNNSWRVDSSGSPYNWDAAWVFVKFRPCGAASTTPWTHGKIDPNAGSNAFGSLQPHATGFASGFYPDSNGVMLRRPGNGIYPNAAASTITLKIDNISSVGQYDVKVFGIEMVYIPQEAYYLGISTNYYTFSDGAGNPLLINSENGFTLYNANSNNTNWLYQSSAMPNSFPKGFKPFYCMKYEISEGQYAAFLNTITSPAQLNRFPANYYVYRNRLNDNGTPPNIYIAEREDRAQNYLSFDDVASYLDWSCLRFMTELEYEKICRGTAPSVLDEYAWGTNTIGQAQTISTAPEDGTETIFAPTNANASYQNYLYNGGDGDRGPLRVGIYAKPTSNSRIATGSAYYGVMEMSGNVIEPVIDFRYTAFDGQWGDGYITSAGAFDVPNWPNAGLGFGWRGGDFYNSVLYLKVSQRQYNGRSDYSSRYQYTGGRGLR
ncbi:MAG: SUMF1/EgtB/PvdO family nonheme iron enzyme [Bacteroidia bacterium]|nr:SUMF1/EgtB/PvdO family nonheme iron enzyme [Bacteroidia bacterium]